MKKFILFSLSLLILLACDYKSNSYSESYPSIYEHPKKLVRNLVDEETLNRVNHPHYIGWLIDKKEQKMLEGLYSIFIYPNKLELNEQEYALSDLIQTRVGLLTKKEYKSNRSCEKVVITYNGYAVSSINMLFKGYIWRFEPTKNK